MTFSGVVQFLLGAVLGVTILGMSGLAAGSYFFNQLSKNPDRPVFPEEKPSTFEDGTKIEGQDEQQTQALESAQSENQPEPEPSPKEDIEPLEPGAYRARVTWPDGLSLRDEPSLDANRLDSILYDQEMIVLRSTDDGVWDRIRLPGTNKEGWVKAGNAERIEED